MMSADNLLNKGEVAARLNCSERTVERLIANDDLPVVRVSDRLLRISSEAVDEFIAANERRVSEPVARTEMMLNAVQLSPLPAN